MRPPCPPVLVALLLAACGGGPAGPIDLPEPPRPGPAELVVYGPSALTVHESALYTARLFTAETASLPDTSLRWRSSNPLVLRVDSGVAVGLGRGTATLSATMGELVASVTVQVRGRLRLVADQAVEAPAMWTLDKGDTLRLEAILVDVDGVPIGERPDVTWGSTDSTVASVNESGVVVGLAPGRMEVRATGDDGGTGLRVDVEPGAWPTVRVAHAAKGLRAVRLVFSSGGPATLSFGEVVNRVVPPGTFIASAPGLPSGAGYDRRTVSARVRPGDHLSVFVVGSDVEAFLAEAWSDGASVVPGSGRIRLVQGWNPYPVVYLRPTGAEPDGVPELCYFDPGETSQYYLLPAGDFDILFQQKYGRDVGWTRLPATAPAGQSVTYVLTGDGPGTMGLLAFPDP